MKKWIYKKKCVVLAESLEQQTDYHRNNFPYKTNEGNATELSTVGHVISERHWKGSFDFTEIVNNYGLKLGTLCQFVRFVSLKLYI